MDPARPATERAARIHLETRVLIPSLDWQQIAEIEGRVLVHGEEEHSGKDYLLLESTAAKVYYIPYTREIEEARGLGKLKSNSFVRLRSRPVNGRLRIEIEDLGYAESFISNRGLPREKVEAMRRQGVYPTDGGWGGWLGRYQDALCQVEANQSLAAMDQHVDRQRGRRLPELER